MRKLDLDCSLVNPFVFEHFRQEQLLIHSNAQLHEEHQPRPGSAISIQSHNVIQAPKVCQDLFTPTMSLRHEKMIEGYLVKAIETKRMLKVKQQHLRYFRVIFSTGKMNVKEDRDDQ